MISVMNTECELGRQADVVDDISIFGVQSPQTTRVSEDNNLNEPRVGCSNEVFSGDGIDLREGSVKTMGSEEARVSSEFVSGESKIKEETGFSDELQSSGERDASVGFVESEKTWSEEARASSEVESKEMDRQMQVRVSEVKAVEIGRNDDFSVGDSEVEQLMTGTEEGARVSSGETNEDGKVSFSEVKAMEVRRNDGSAVGDSEMEQLITRTDEGDKVSPGKIKGDGEVMDKPIVFCVDQSYSTADEDTGTGMLEAFGSEAARALSYGFEPGDMVWGKVKSHPWWPGHIYHEAFASSSVRRTKREGHILVAFFGDSSYGWFDPAELIPFEPHYADKSRQTNSRNFMKAVEEAVDEAKRRSALGLACRCRNPNNFRPLHVQGYFSVAVGSSEPGEVYSVKQIKKARESFQPDDALTFVQELALTPRNNEQRSIDWIKNISAILAYRKAAFEEFDETYAQAFGMQPVRPKRDSTGVMDQPAKVPPRAPLSGPLVIAEALGEKNSAKPMKVKDQSKKDKYLLKRRDEPNEPRVRHGLGVAGFVSSSAYKEGSAAMAPGDYVLQKRTPGVLMKPQVPVKQEGTGTIRGAPAGLIRGGTIPGSESVGRKLVTAKFSSVDAQVNMAPVDSLAGLAGGVPTDQPVAYGTPPAMQQDPEDGKLNLDKESAFNKMNGSMASGGSVVPTSTGLDGSFPLGKPEAPGVLDSVVHNFQRESRAMVDSKCEGSDKLSGMFEGLEHPKQRMSMPVEEHSGPDQVWEGDGSRNVSESMSTRILPTDAKLPGRDLGTSGDGVVKKVKVLKRPGAGLNPEKSIMGEKRKKKLKPGLETYPEHPQKRLKTAKDEESVRKSAGRSIGIGLAPREITQVDTQRKDNAVSGNFLSSEPAMSIPKVDLENTEVELPQLVSDLMSLALDPFHGFERNGPAIVRQVLLHFRSLVYQKSLVLAPPSEAETTEFCASRSPASTGASDIPSGEDVRDMPSKQPKNLMRPEDPTKAGRKRSRSDRQEEMTAKKLKKKSEMKLIAAEKKTVNHKISEIQRGEPKEMGATVPSKSLRPDSVKKLELPAKVAEPAMLVMRFPPRTTLPSIPELKARFGRFGPLDHSAMRVFWKTSTCRVVFKHRPDAQSAYTYAVGSKGLFGQVKVNYQLRDVGAPAAVVLESANRRLDDASDEFLQSRIGGGNDLVGEPRPMAAIQRPHQPSVQLKSCLKKPLGEEAGPALGVTRESPRVKFMLGAEESYREEQLMVSSNSSKDNNNGSSADGGASSSIAMGVNSKNFQKVIPTSLPPLLPLPSRVTDVHENRGVGHFTKAAHAHYSEVVEPRNNNNSNTTNSNTNGIDISHQMLNLLMRCNDIVNEVTSSLGYLPYHPL